MFEKRSLENLTIDSFQPHTGQEFSVENLSQPVGLRLISASAGKGSLTLEKERASFSLTFKSNQQQVLPQSCYRLANKQFGEVAIFLVPVTRDADGITYQAVFN
ncbi:MAG: hypothetical protein V4568_12900 [Pseudomonadota bacterium]